MADNTPAAQPSLTELLQQAASEVSPETQAAVIQHPNTPSMFQHLSDAIRTSLGMGTKQDVMGTNEQRAAKDAGLSTMAHPENGADIAPTPTPAPTVAPTGDSANHGNPAHEGFLNMIEGVGKLFTTQLMHGYKAAGDEAALSKSKSKDTK